MCEIDCVCVCERERVCVCVRKRDRERVCVCGREREREREREEVASLAKVHAAEHKQVTDSAQARQVERESARERA